MTILYSELLLSHSLSLYCYINRITYPHTHMIVKKINVSVRNECQKIHSNTSLFIAVRRSCHSVQGGSPDQRAGLGSWVDFDFASYTFCEVLIGLMGNWQKWLSRWARWWNITDQSQLNPTQLSDQMDHPVPYR